ncbi:hypothetical protein FB567DRAFT_526611 [Paraphoma chrysanthemicola]|uniref:C2H2-type domain-containing protein n=1 Tax=Paraphoma chrysanthemicola TaxID=798071 RepID=A0A8K0VY94_9PLEO|nr:hypothetical protein FB567DRAFT_526611 [Paraphoma chrysanthemicola]
MAQGNRGGPRFEFNVQHFPFDAGLSRPSINGSQQWVPPVQRSGPRSVQHNLPSPSVSTRSAATAPARWPDHSNLLQPNLATASGKSDPNFLGLEYSLSSPSHAGNSNYDALGRSCHEAPWDPYHLRTSDDESSMNQHNASFKNYRNGPGSISSAVAPSDSGFWTQSVVSHDPSRLDQSYVSSNLTQHVDKLKVRSVASEVPRMARVSPDQRSQISQLSSRSGNQGQSLKCDACGEESRCKSDYKKHKLKHEKPFKCHEPNCKRTGLGFATVNDLDRHKKSVHHIGILKKSYQCASESCRSKEKIWPRLDNFKQHIERMHKGEDAEDLIKRSMFTPKHPGTSPSSVSIAPMETMIVGMEKTFSNQVNYAPPPSLGLNTDQNLSQWPASLNPADLPLNLYNMQSPLVGQRPKSSEMGRSVSNSSLRFQTSFDGSMQAKLHSESKDHVKRTQRVQKCGTEPHTASHPKISSAPQTKAQQQKEALSKLSQAVSDKMSESSTSKPVNLEELILGILQRSTGVEEDEEDHIDSDLASTNGRRQPERKVTLTKKEAMNATQAISNLIKQSPSSAFSQPRRPLQGFTANSQTCPFCGYSVGRACDLKKHMRRHEKPYGCTYPKCTKRFGAKSDWKRHENSQHFQLEAFRCRLLSTVSNKTCGEHFFRVSAFKEHLKTQHRIDDPDTQETEARARRIGKNCQQQFWCGFCNDIIVLNEKRNAAWDERFDHIAKHFETDKKNIEDWVCVEENKTKKDIEKERDRNVFDYEDERDRRGRSTHPTPPPPPPPLDPNLPPPRTRSPPPPPPGYTQPQPSSSKKRGLEHHHAQGQPNKRARTHHAATYVDVTQRDEVDYRFCCQCGDGPINPVNQPGCTGYNCGHTICSRCPEP